MEVIKLFSYSFLYSFCDTISKNWRILMPKYSIIIPCYNGMPYVKSCVDSIINQNYTDYELIISEDHSVDGTADYIDTLSNIPNITVLHCPKRMSMAEHWEWALSHAAGEWQMFVGQDDGLQNYFFELADKLIDICNKKKLDVIMSERAYYFWPGCEETYGEIKVLYRACNKYGILSVKKEMERCLWKDKLSYMDFPSMYTTSLIRKKFIDKVIEKQKGKLFITHPQDANLAAVVTLFAKKYIKSYIPLGWVGSSVKSAGLAITLLNKKNELGGEYLRTVNDSSLKRHPLSAPFELSSFCLYYWSALLTVSEIHDKRIYKMLLDKKIKLKVFSLAYNDLKYETNEYFDELLKKNNINIDELKIKRTVIFKNYQKRKPLIIERLFFKFFHIIEKIWKALFEGKLNFCKDFMFQCNQNESSLNLFEFSKSIDNKLIKK